METIRVLLADERTLFRDGLRSLLAENRDFEVVAHTDDGEEALRSLSETKPQVLVAGARVTGMDVLELTEAVTARWPAVSVAIVTGFRSAAHVLQAVRAGAAGYLLKSATSEEFLTAVRAIACGETYFCSWASQVLAQEGRARATNLFPYRYLTKQQLRIFRLSAEGHSPKEISRLLKVSDKTVYFHRSQAMEKLGITGLTGLMHYAIQTGLVVSSG